MFGSMAFSKSLLRSRRVAPTTVFQLALARRIPAGRKYLRFQAGTRSVRGLSSGRVSLRLEVPSSTIRSCSRMFRKAVKHPEHGIVQQFNAGFTKSDPKDRVVVVNSGKVTCVGPSGSCAGFMSSDPRRTNLRGGVISPGLTSFGSILGLQEIELEPSTGPGQPYNALVQDIPGIVGDIGGVERASDALLFHTRSAL